MHDPTQVLLGGTESSDRVITCENSDPASFPAGTAVRRKNDATLSVSSSDGSLIGVSLGRSLSDTKKTAVCRVGAKVPVLLTDEGVLDSVKIGDITFNSKVKADTGITITLADTADAGEEVASVTGTAITIAMESTVSTAQQIVDAILASAEVSALITAAIDSGDEAVAQAAATSTALTGGASSYPYVVKGTAVKVSNSTGLAASTGSTTGAIYVDGPKTGIKLDGTTAQVAVIDMVGGL